MMHFPYFRFPYEKISKPTAFCKKIPLFTKLSDALFIVIYSKFVTSPYFISPISVHFSLYHKNVISPIFNIFPIFAFNLHVFCLIYVFRSPFLTMMHLHHALLVLDAPVRNRIRWLYISKALP